MSARVDRDDAGSAVVHRDDVARRRVWQGRAGRGVAGERHAEVVSSTRCAVDGRGFPSATARCVALCRLIEVDRGRTVETVFIPETSVAGVSRGVLCVSSQVGCSLDCSFCLTGVRRRCARFPSHVFTLLSHD